MSSGSYTARHRAPGRHREERSRSLPRALTPQFILPTAAAATLVLTTTGATMAGSAPLELQTSSIDVALAQSQVSESRSDTVALAERRTATTGQTALLQGRQQEADRIARDKEREALAKKQAEEAKAKADAKAEEEARRAAQRWVMPMDNYRYTSGFGSRWGRLHAGIDLAAPMGTPIKSVSSGTVIKAAHTGACGNNVWVKHYEGTVTRYCHLDYISVGVGQRVAPGEKLGGNGNTGRSYGPHLHFEVRPGGENADPVDPIGWLRAKGLGL
ncbi:MAG: M23 family metallopeptidase [Intrasporangiaceae bacterium]|nr:M23 family metallopeptidase [Intrasporangiaceae bacterium]